MAAYIALLIGTLIQHKQVTQWLRLSVTDHINVHSIAFTIHTDCMSLMYRGGEACVTAVMG